MDLGILIIRGVVGLVLAAHGAATRRTRSWASPSPTGSELPAPSHS